MKLKLGLKKKTATHVDGDLEEQMEKEVASKPAVKNTGWMKQGFQAANKEIAQNKARQGSFTPDFWLKDGEEAVVRFISGEPLCMYQHRVQVSGKWRTHTCLGDNCPLCEGGNKKQFVGVFSIIDRRKEEWTDKNTGKPVKRQNTVKMWRAGTRVMASLERLTAKRGSLTGYDINVSRSGESTATVYTLIPDDPSELSAADKALKPLDLVTLLAPKSRQELLAGVNAGKTDDEQVVEQF